MNTSVKKIKFIEKLSEIVKEMETFQETEANHWKPEYEVMLEELNDILRTAKGNISNAEERFKDVPIAKFPSFKDYVINTDVEILKRDSGSNSRFKSSRTKRKKHSTCPQCGETMHLVDNQFQCEKCNYALEVKSNKAGSISGEETKHSNKLLHTIAGIGKPPGSVQKILNFAVTWLTDLHYIKDWFINHKQRYEAFSKAYKHETHTCLTSTFFDRVIERKPENLWHINIYRLMMNEFQQMLEEAKALSKVSSNMWYLQKSEILSIVNNYIAQHGKEIPKEDVKTEDGYEIGAYFVQLSLLPVFTSDHVKAELEKIYNKSLSMAGLSFNFNEAFKRSDTVIRRYDLLQGNSWIQRYVFNMPPSTITEAELSSILEIMSQFNIYYKEYWYKQKLKSCNSPLYAVVLDMILELPAFKRFRNELMIFVQRKEPKTRTQISNTWIRFEQEKKEFLSQFVKVDTQSPISYENLHETTELEESYDEEESDFEDEIYF